jgi:hypothetical protein
VPHGSALLATLLPILVQFVIFLRWLHRRMRNDEITRAFVRDIATNHCRTFTTRCSKSPQSRELRWTKRHWCNSST